MNTSKKALFSWYMYDWAYSAFAVTVLAGFFPLFFNKYWSAGAHTNLSTFRLGVGSTVAGLLIAFLSLFMGSIVGVGRGKKRFLALFMLLGTTSTFGLYFISHGNWLGALIVFILGNIGFSCSDLFYNSLLVDVAEKKKMDRVSSIGFSFGYLGCGILFLVNVLMVTYPNFFGFESEIHAIRVSFLTVAIWWGVFSVPLFLFVKEKEIRYSQVTKPALLNTLSNLKNTFRLIAKNRSVFLFICAYWLYIDGLNTFIRMAIDFGLSIGFSSRALMIALLAVQFIAFPSALGFGLLARYFGAQKMILFGILIYIVVIGGGAFVLENEIQFIILASLTAIAQGGIQALSRSYYGKLIPQGKASEYFGFYNVVGRFAVAGPLLVGMVTFFSHLLGLKATLASRVGMSSIVLLFVSGAVFLIMAEKTRKKVSISSIGNVDVKIVGEKI
ncbi:MFS transporter [Chitinispirillales bacterium ANBcel5]|uniref:MFS transporter n=1 Tax=Cellulosispirillum alkaliphilum TaxID=3039283 RepID=UPI002A56FF6A|nr:MFS transporter [Chitinispirillales bacterium ANBcel5]